MSPRPTGRFASWSACGLLSAALLLMTGWASAGSFRISPTLSEVAPGQTVATFTLANAGSERVSVQVDALDWTQSATGERREPSSDVAVVPRIVTLAPGATQMVRVALRSERDRERAFRVRFRELPGAVPDGFVGVRTTLHIDVPLFFHAARGEAQVDWALQRSADGGLHLHAANGGARFLQAAALRLEDGRGALLATGPSPAYVLAGQRMQWPLAAKATLAVGEPVMLVYEQRGKRVTLPLAVEAQ
jgi:fimbrial chaperone protein